MQRAGKTAVTFSEKFRNLRESLKGRCSAPFYQFAGRKTDICFAIVADHVHSKRIVVFAHPKASVVMHTREETPAEQLNHSLVGLPPPDENTGTHTVVRGVQYRYSMCHVF